MTYTLNESEWVFSHPMDRFLPLPPPAFHILSSPSLSCCKYPQQWTDPANVLKSTQRCAETTSHAQSAQAGLRKYQQNINGPSQSKKLSRTEAGGARAATISSARPGGGQRATRATSEGDEASSWPSIAPGTAPGFLVSSTVTVMHTDKLRAGPLVQQALHVAERKDTLLQLLPKSAGRDLKKIDCNITT